MIGTTRTPMLMQLVKKFSSGDDEYHGKPPFIAVIPVLKALYISGVTKDSTGTPLPNTTVQLFRTANDQCMEEIISDGSGNYAFSPVGLGQYYYIVAYKVGVPDVSGTTRNDLVGT